MTSTDVTTGAQSSLFKINMTTGRSTLIGPLGYDIEGRGGLAFSPSGILYAIESEDGSVYTVSLTNGQATFLGSLESAQNQLPGVINKIPPGDADYTYLAFNANNGNLYAIDVGIADSYSDLVQIDTVPGSFGFAHTNGKVDVFPLSIQLGGSGGMTVVNPANATAYVADTEYEPQGSNNAIDHLYTLNLNTKAIDWIGTPSVSPLLSGLAYSSCTAPVPLPVFGTGLSSTGALLPTNPVPTMPSDQNYTLAATLPPSYYGTSPSVNATGPAYVLSSSAYPIGGYVADSTTSEWISPDPSGYDESYCSGYYDYQTKFVIPEGFDSNTAVLTGDWAVDNDGQIFLNGLPVNSSSGGAIPTDRPTSFDTLHSFTIGSYSDVTFNSYPTPNTLDFVVNNSDNDSSTGLRVDLSGTVCCDNQAKIPTLFGTGLNASGTQLTPAIATDSHYTITSSPEGFAGSTHTVQPGVFPFPPWVADSADPSSRWITPGDADDHGDDPAGYYVYQTTFNLTGFVPSTATITGQWASDDTGLFIILNKTTINETTARAPATTTRSTRSASPPGSFRA